MILTFKLLASGIFRSIPLEVFLSYMLILLSAWEKWHEDEKRFPKLIAQNKTEILKKVRQIWYEIQNEMCGEKDNYANAEALITPIGKEIIIYVMTCVEIWELRQNDD